MTEATDGAQTASEPNNAPPPAPAAPTTPPPPTMAARLDDVDFLTMENLDLKLRNQQLALREIESQKALCVSNIGELARQLEAKRTELSVKYGRPVRRDTVAADGTFVKKA